MVAPSIRPWSDWVFLPEGWTFDTLFVAASKQYQPPARSQRLAPWIDGIRGDATEVIHLDDDFPRLDVAR